MYVYIERISLFTHRRLLLLTQPALVCRATKDHFFTLSLSLPQSSLAYMNWSRDFSLLLVVPTIRYQRTTCGRNSKIIRRVVGNIALTILLGTLVVSLHIYVYLYTNRWRVNQCHKIRTNDWGAIKFPLLFFPMLFSNMKSSSIMPTNAECRSSYDVLSDIYYYYSHALYTYVRTCMCACQLFTKIPFQSSDHNVQ